MSASSQVNVKRLALTVGKLYGFLSGLSMVEYFE